MVLWVGPKVSAWSRKVNEQNRISNAMKRLCCSCKCISSCQGEYLEAVRRVFTSKWGPFVFCHERRVDWSSCSWNAAQFLMLIPYYPQAGHCGIGSRNDWVQKRGCHCSGGAKQRRAQRVKTEFTSVSIPSILPIWDALLHRPSQGDGEVVSHMYLHVQLQKTNRESATQNCEASDRWNKNDKPKCSPTYSDQVAQLDNNHGLNPTIPLFLEPQGTRAQLLASRARQVSSKIHHKPPKITG